MKVLEKHIRDKMARSRWKKETQPKSLSKTAEQDREEVYRFLQYRRFYKRKFKQQKQNRDDYFSAIRDRREGQTV